MVVLVYFPTEVFRLPPNRAF